jgi:hypothetical protein
MATTDTTIKKVLPRFLKLPKAAPVFLTLTIWRNGNISMDEYGVKDVATRYLVSWSRATTATTMRNRERRLSFPKITCLI